KAKSEAAVNVKVFTSKELALMVERILTDYSLSDEISLNHNNQRRHINLLWRILHERSWDLEHFENLQIVPTNRGTLRKLKSRQKCLFNPRENESLLLKNVMLVFQNLDCPFIADD